MLASVRADAGRPAGSATMRFSTSPPSVTITTSARWSPSGTNSMCLSGASAFGEITSPAQRDGPASVDDASSSISDTVRPAAAHLPSMLARSSALMSPPISSRPSTNIRRPASVGSRPAEVCGAYSSPASSRSAITLRMEAGDSTSPSRRDSVREPTGSPVST